MSQRMIYSAQGRIVGHAQGIERAWDDDHVVSVRVIGSAGQSAKFMQFEQFTQSDVRTMTDRHYISRADIIRVRILLSKALLSLTSELQTKIGELERLIATDKATLQADLRLARCLSILTPFMASTRQKICAAAVPISQRVRKTRLSLCKNVVMVRCYSM